MKTTHVSDHDIQQFTFDLSECEAEIIKHIDSCGACKKRAEIYLSLSNTIKDQPDPVFEFNLAELVLKQLETSPEKQSVYTYIIYFLIMLSIGVVVSVLYFFKDIFIDLFSNTTAIPIYFIISVAMLISFTLGLDISRTFNKKINMLNY
jgi:hypothetical protein